MNLSGYFAILVAFAIGYLLGTFTSRLLKFVLGIVGLFIIIVVLYWYFLR